MKDADPIETLSPRAEQLVEDFEAAWEQGKAPEPGAYWQSEGSTALLVELLHVDLERRLKANLPVSVPAYLEQFPALAAHPDAIVGLAWTEYQRRYDRQVAGLGLAKFLQQYPAYRSALFARIKHAEGAVAENGAVPANLTESREAALRAASSAAPENAAIVRLLEEGQFLRQVHLDKLKRDLQYRCADPAALLKYLSQWGWITGYQAAEILAGRGQALILGPYLLLEPLGQGGMGQVFKARHQVMRRTVALKLIRKDRLTPAAVQRFHREIQAAAQLFHPNIVVAHDAGQIGEVHFFAMEHVEGIDLGKLLDQEGRLPVAQACDYVRQAALGLQHAHERGLIHRDIKPSNLLCSKPSPNSTSRGDVIKILDLGLARLQDATKDERGRLMTRFGMVMGTPDYMAPEQAIDARGVDIRADIYSLGCTLFHLLTGHPPFPGKSWEEKASGHRQVPAPSPAALRPEVPAALAKVVTRMMAKQPADRYQAPAEVADALAPFCEPANSKSVPPSPAPVPQTVRPVAPVVLAPPPQQATVLPAAETLPPQPSRLHDEWFSLGMIGGIAFLLLMLAVAASGIVLLLAVLVPRSA